MTYDEALRCRTAVVPNCTLHYVTQVLGSSMSVIKDVTAHSYEFDFKAMYADTVTFACLSNSSITKVVAVSLQKIEPNLDCKYLDGTIFVTGDDKYETHFKLYGNTLVTIQILYLEGTSYVVPSGMLTFEQALSIAQDRYISYSSV